MAQNPDLDWRNALRAGDERAQRAFFDEHYAAVRGYILRCHSRNHSEHDADEITNDTFLRAFRSIGYFDGNSSVRTWLLSLGRHAAIDYYRRGKQIPRTRSPASELPEPDATSHPSSGSDHDPFQDLVGKEKRARLRAHIRELDQDHREVIQLRVLNGLSILDTSGVMERSEAAVKMLFLRALQKLSLRLLADPYFSEDINAPESETP